VSPAARSSMGDGADAYTDQLLGHARATRNRGRIAGAPIHADGDNPVCGDHLEAWATLDARGRIERAAFEGEGCAISLAAASLLFEDVRGRTLDEVQRLDREHIFELLGLELSTSRVKCGTLGLAVLKDGIQAYVRERHA
jgi:nitrogen fixation protein NifU and related proteins